MEPAKKRGQGPRHKSGHVAKDLGNKKIRTLDDLDLIRLILEEDPPLKERVIRRLEVALGRPTGSGSKR